MAVALSTFMPGWGAGTLTVEIAWGADITALASTWTWTDITTDVRQDPGISVSMGRGDEASTAQPAEATMVLDNTTGAYSLGGLSSNWPNVRRGTPVRVRIDPDGTGARVVFCGFATGFTPSWEITGEIATVELAAAGALRRLGQGQAPVLSSLRRGLAVEPTAVAYWPCEEGRDAGRFEPVIGQYPMTWTDAIPSMAANSTFDSSLPIPELNNSRWVGTVPIYTATGEIQVRFICEFPESGEPIGTILTVYTTGTAEYRLTYDPAFGGTLQVSAYNILGGLISSSGVFSFNVNGDPRARLFSLGLTQNGANVDVQFGTIDRTSESAGFATTTIAGQTLGNARGVVINGSGAANAAGALDSVAVGHVIVQDQITSFFADSNELSAWVGETVEDRIVRLCAENDETVDVIGASDVEMGPQSVATLLELLRECEAADQGVLFDGLTAGLTYVCRTERESQPADLTIDAAAGQLAAPFAPVDDDQRTRNKAVVTRKDGITVVHEDTDGPLGTETIGIYDTAATVNLANDEDIAHYAGWFVHQGTQDGYRYPSVALDLRATPTLARDALAIGPSDRLDIDNLDDTLAGHPDPSLSLLVEGVAHEVSAGSWRTTLKCSPYSPWRTIRLASTTNLWYQFTSGPLYFSSDTLISPILQPALSQFRAGDVLLCLASIRNPAGTVIFPDGWDPLVTVGNVVLAGRCARDGDVGPQITFTGAIANATVAAQCFAIADADPDTSAIVVASATQLNASAQDVAFPALTVPVDDSLVLVIGWKQDNWTGVTAVAGFNELVDPSTISGDDVGHVLDYMIQTTATNIAAGTLVVTGGAAAISRAMTVALRPAPYQTWTHLDTDASTLNGAISAGATSISVTTTSGPLWTADAPDMPYDIGIGGVRHTVTACSDATSPQTMTISAAPVSRASGLPVAVWDPPVLAL